MGTPAMTAEQAAQRVGLVHDVLRSATGARTVGEGLRRFAVLCHLATSHEDAETERALADMKAPQVKEPRS
ncbi:MAG: hypothetical protein IPG50_21740 [Myxococcales bacterium]|nr:hypothetical protein [Myxococcales bacterium]